MNPVTICMKEYAQATKEVKRLPVQLMKVVRWYLLCMYSIGSPLVFSSSFFKRLLFDFDSSDFWVASTRSTEDLKEVSIPNDHYPHAFRDLPPVTAVEIRNKYYNIILLPRPRRAFPETRAG